MYNFGKLTFEVVKVHQPLLVITYTTENLKEKKLSFTKIISDIIFMYQFQLISIKIVPKLSTKIFELKKTF